eukprot:gene25673-27913_t
MVGVDPEIVRVLPQADMPEMECFLVYPEEMKNVARVQVFRDFLVATSVVYPQAEVPLAAGAQTRNHVVALTAVFTHRFLPAVGRLPGIFLRDACILPLHRKAEFDANGRAGAFAPAPPLRVG